MKPTSIATDDRATSPGLLTNLSDQCQIRSMSVFCPHPQSSSA